RRCGFAGGDAGADGQVRHERRAVAARSLRNAQNQAAAARGRSRGQDRREDGLSACFLRIPGGVGREDRSRGDQVRPDSVSVGGGGQVTPVTAAVADIPHLTPVPPLPRTLEETGLPADLVEQLLIKTLYGGELTGHAIVHRMCLPYGILEPIIERVRAERHVEVRGATGSGTAGYRYALTDAGRDRARQYLAQNQYAGAAPVPLDAYVAEMRALAGSRGFIEPDRLRQGFQHLVVNETVLEQLGPAINAAKA